METVRSDIIKVNIDTLAIILKSRYPEVCNQARRWIINPFVPTSRTLVQIVECEGLINEGELNDGVAGVRLMKKKV